MSKILRKSLTFVAALALLVAPVAANAAPLTIVGGNGGDGGNASTVNVLDGDDGGPASPLPVADPASTVTDPTDGADGDDVPGVGGDGGDGGSITYNNTTATWNDTGITGGAGGNGGTAVGDTFVGGDGGAAGTVTFNSTGAVTFGAMTIIGGAGGANGAGDAAGALGGDGKNGGSVTLNFWNNVTFTGILDIDGGIGGAVQGTPHANDGSAGVGGAVIFNAAGQTVSVAGATTLNIGAVGANTGALGGAVEFRAGTLIATGGLALTGRANTNDTALIFRVDELWFNADATFAASNIKGGLVDNDKGVYIDTLTIGGLENNGSSVGAVTLAHTAEAAIGTGTNLEGAYGFGGTLKVIGFDHKITSAVNLGKVTTLIFELSNDDLFDEILLSVDSDLDITNTNIKILTGTAMNSAMEIGDEFVLVDQVYNDDTVIDKMVYSTGGLITDYAFLVEHDGNDGNSLYATYEGEVLNNGAAHSVAMAASAPSIAQLGGKDLLSSLIDTGNVIGLLNNGTKIEMLLGLSGGIDNVELSSEIDSNRFNLAVGPALNMGIIGGTATFGAFFEAGWSTYDVTNEYSVLHEDAPLGVYPYNGSGKAHYFGGGVLAGVVVDSGFHADASVAFGRVTNSFTPSWFDDAAFELKSNYVGVHLGVGYLIPINETSGVDVYGKLLWNHQFKSDTINDAGELLQFAAFNAARTLLGANYTLELTANASMHAGLAWEYQFETQQDITVGSNIIVEPAIFKGHTGVLEFGFDVKASDNVAIGLDLMGAYGKRTGFGGNLTLGVSF